LLKNPAWWKIYIQYSEFRAHSVFQSKRKLLKNPECTNYSENFQGKLCFSGQAQSFWNILNGKIYIQYSENFQPELHNIMKVYAVIPATTCTAKRSFSGLRRMKTYLRNTKGQDRLNGVALINNERCYANKVIENDTDSVLDAFVKREHSHKYFFW